MGAGEKVALVQERFVIAREIEPTEQPLLDAGPGCKGQFSNRHILMNFWADWCKPCVGEMPMLQKTYNEVNDKYVFIMVADQDLETIKKFKSKNKYNFVFVKSKEKVTEKVGAIPTTFILDKSQDIIFSQTGSFDDEKQLKDLLAAKSKN